MPIKQIDHNSKEYELMVQLRYDILRKPLDLHFDEKELEKENVFIINEKEITDDQKLFVKDFFKGFLNNKKSPEFRGI